MMHDNYTPKEYEWKKGFPTEDGLYVLMSGSLLLSSNKILAKKQGDVYISIPSHTIVTLELVHEHLIGFIGPLPE